VRARASGGGMVRNVTGWPTLVVFRRNMERGFESEETKLAVESREWRMW
jgi:hypothetical protein